MKKDKIKGVNGKNVNEGYNMKQLRYRDVVWLYLAYIIVTTALIASDPPVGKHNPFEVIARLFVWPWTAERIFKFSVLMILPMLFGCFISRHLKMGRRISLAVVSCAGFITLYFLPDPFCGIEILFLKSKTFTLCSFLLSSTLYEKGLSYAGRIKEKWLQWERHGREDVGYRDLRYYLIMGVIFQMLVIILVEKGIRESLVDIDFLSDPLEIFFGPLTTFLAFCFPLIISTFFCYIIRLGKGTTRKMNLTICSLFGFCLFAITFMVWNIGGWRLWRMPLEVGAGCMCSFSLTMVRILRQEKQRERP